MFWVGVLALRDGHRGIRPLRQRQQDDSLIEGQDNSHLG